MTALNASQTIADLIETIRYTGMRPGEARNQTWRQIDRSGDVWFYKPVDHKTRRSIKKRRDVDCGSRFNGPRRKRKISRESERDEKKGVALSKGNQSLKSDLTAKGDIGELRRKT